MIKEKSNKFLDITTTVILIIVIVLFILSKIFMICRVSGNSMYPTYHDKEFIACNRFCKINEYNKGDVITFYSGNKYFSDIYIKRIVAVPGDTVQIINGYLYVNDEKQNTVLPEMAVEGIACNLIKLKENEFFVLGDNRNNSKDSRFLGPIKYNKVIGKIFNQKQEKQI